MLGKNLPTEEIIPALRMDELSENEYLRSESNTHRDGEGLRLTV